jgi:MSHA biogenesis protein MshP
MSRKSSPFRSITRRLQAGFSIVSAIFLLVVLAALGAAMVTFSTVQHATSAQDLEASKAYQAARAGIEWGLFQVMQPGTAPAATVCATPGLALAGNLSGFTVVVACTRTSATEGGAAVEIYQITSTASQGGPAGSMHYVERQLQVTASRGG